MIRRLLPLLALLCATPAVAAGDPPAWTEAAEPFHIAGPIYYVGSKGLAAYLIVSPKGAMLLDGTLAANVPMIERNIRKLGLRLSQVKILLNSHAHFDHAEGLAQLKRDTGAAMLAVGLERPALESGLPPSDNSYGEVPFPPVKVDRVLRDGETVRLGNLAMTAVVTPGHTPGCTTWKTTVMEKGRRLHVVFPCSITVAGNRLVGNRGYPGIAADYRRSFDILAAMPADIVLPPHPEIADVMGRQARLQKGERDAFVEPGQLQKIVATSRAAFEQELGKPAAR